MTNFADMSTTTRAGWQSWARSHDWGREALFEGAGDAPGPFLMINLHPQDLDDEFGGGHVKPHVFTDHRIGFRDPQTLRDWAGY